MSGKRISLFVEKRTSPEEEERMRIAREKAFMNLQMMRKVRVDKQTIKLVEYESETKTVR